MNNKIGLKSFIILKKISNTVIIVFNASKTRTNNDKGGKKVFSKIHTIHTIAKKDKKEKINIYFL